MNIREFLEHTARDPQTILHEKQSNREDISRPVPETLSIADALDDLAYFRMIIEQGYSGYTYYEKQLFDNGFENIEKELRAMGESVVTTDMLKSISENLKFISDGHLGIMAGKDVYRFFIRLVAYVADIKLRKNGEAFICTECGKEVSFSEPVIIFDTLPDENGPLYLIGVRSKETVEKITVKIDGVDTELAVHPMASEPRPTERPDGMITERYYDDVAVVSCKTCVGNTAKYLESFRRAGERCRTCNHVIFDLVNNSGGNSVFPETFFRSLYGWVYDRSTGKRYDSSLLRAKRFGEVEENIPYTYEEWGSEGEQEGERGENIFKGSLHVVINNRVASSGELAVVMACGYDDVKFYGTNSAGIGKYGDVLTWFLPKSNAIVRAPYKIFDNGIEETVGHTPDYWIDSEDPVGAVKAHVENLKK